ncbi:MAG: hypothetical protein ABI675_02395 [Chitinophagaceae bacterium]
MTSCFKSTRFSWVVLFILFFTAACNNGADEKKADEKSATDATEKKSADELNPHQQVLTTGSLDTLWVDSLSFTQLPDSQKVVFVYTFLPQDTLTLHGWSAKKDSVFGPNPDIKLLKGHAGTLTYGNGLYFGNVVLKKNAVKNIQKALKGNHAKYVLFAPQMVDATHIGYTIFLSIEHPAIAKEFAVIATGAAANPSPPKTY